MTIKMAISIKVKFCKLVGRKREYKLIVELMEYNDEHNFGHNRQESRALFHSIIGNFKNIHSR